MAIIFALITFLGWGVGEFLSAIASRKLGSIKAFFWIFLLSLPLASLYLPFVQLPTDMQMLYLAFFIQFIHMIGNLTYFKGLEEGNASLVNPIAGTFGVIIVLLSFIFFKEHIIAIQGIGILLSLLGVLIVIFPWTSLTSITLKSINHDKGIPFAVITSVLWGISFTFIKIPAIHIGWFWAYFPLILLSPLSYFYAKSKKVKIRISGLSILPFLIIPAILITLGNFTYNLGVMEGYVSIVAPIASSSPVIFVILARLFLNDKLTKQQGIGIICTLVGIVILGLA